MSVRGSDVVAVSLPTHLVIGSVIVFFSAVLRLQGTTASHLLQEPDLRAATEECEELRWSDGGRGAVCARIAIPVLHESEWIPKL